MSTFNIQHILTPIDLSDSSLNAVEAAGVIAEATGATLHLLFVEERLQQSGASGLLPSSLHPSSKEVLPALAAALKTKYRIPVELLMTTGNVTETILQTAQASAADLIVMGTHGASGIRDGFAGHNTYYTIKHSPVPVMAVPVTCSPSLFRHVIYPVRLIDGAQMRHDLVLPLIHAGAQVELLSIAQQMPEVGHRALHAFSDEVRDRCAAKKVQIKMATGTTVRIGKELVHYASRVAGALVVVNSALDMNGNNHFIGPHTQKAINGLKNPLLFVPLSWEQSAKGQETVVKSVAAI